MERKILVLFLVPLLLSRPDEATADETPSISWAAGAGLSSWGHFSSILQRGRTIRLVNGARSSEGRVEVLLNIVGQNVWTTVCGAHLDVNDAKVICRSMGYATNAPLVKTGAYYGRGTSAIVLNYLFQCRGTEQSLKYCPVSAVSTLCDHSQDVGVNCRPRLFVAVCVASIVFSVYLIQHKPLRSTAASARSEWWPFFFASPSSSSSSERSPLSELSSTFPVTSPMPSPSPQPPSPSLSPKNSSSKSPAQSSSSFTGVLCKRFTGRLGNELFEYASTLGLALILKRLPVFLGSHYLPFALTSFNQTSASFSRFEKRCKLSARASEVSCCKFEEKLTRLNSSQDFTIRLYLQSYRYFQDHEAVIRQALTFTREIRSESSKVVQELRQNHSTSTLIGVHVRRGDLARERNRKLGYPQVTPDYLNRSMAFFRSRYPDCVFVVGSDSPEWCKENILSGHHVHYLTAHSPAVDMHVLSSLDHTVITFGTFSWWIGFFNAGTTVYMKDFIVNGTWLGGAFNPDGRDYIYPGWIPL